jgi:recombination protein RecA
MSESKLKQLIDQANEEWGAGTIIIPELGGKMVNDTPEIISSGFSFIDAAIGIGGIACGRITEIMGQEAGGKTTLALHFIASAQKMGKRCAFIDVEHALDRERALKIGVKFDSLAISQPDNMEQALELLEFLVKSHQFGMVVVDSVAALIPKVEIDGEMSEANIGVKARLMGKIMRKLVPIANKNMVAVVFTNQVRAKLGGFGFIPQETTPGGNALKFAASLRLDVKRTGNKKRGDVLLYTTHKMIVKKNKLAAPAKVALFNIGENGIINEVVKTDDV